MLRGPGRRFDRLDKPITDALAELYFCERMQYRIMPTGLTPGSINDQPADALFRWMQLMGLEASQRERFEAIRMRQNR